MTLTFRVFHPEKTKKRKLTNSEKLSKYAFVSFLISAILFLFLKATNLHSLDFLLSIILVVCMFIHISSFFVRINEFETLYGTFGESFKFGENAIEFESKSFMYEDISNFQIQIIDFYGASTNNYRYGPMYKNGTSNYLSFVIAREKKEFYFEIKTEYFITAIYYHLIDIICNEKLPFQKEYLNLIPKKYKTFVVYSDFISRLKAENKI